MLILLGFWSYLWGIETEGTIRGWLDNPEVLILPMRDWNGKNVFLIKNASSVLILPMRDWNPFRPLSICCSFPFWSYLWGIETLDGTRTYTATPMFWSYLWGIETRLWTTTLYRWYSVVLILPMRDWNIEVHDFFEIWIVVLILPMRDWNTF